MQLYSEHRQFKCVQYTLLIVLIVKYHIKLNFKNLKLIFFLDTVSKYCNLQNIDNYLQTLQTLSSIG